MAYDFSPFDPFQIFRAPLSGNVSQQITAPWFSPALTVNYAGNASIETRVVSEVASYGRQIGWLSEIALALSTGKKPPADTLKKLERALKAIEAIKQDTRRSVEEQAGDALDRLEQESPDEAARLLRDRLERLTRKKTL